MKGKQDPKCTVAIMTIKGDEIPQMKRETGIWERRKKGIILYIHTYIWMCIQDR